MNFATPIEKLSISRAYQQKLKRLGIQRVADLLFHFPHRYEDFSKIVKIKDIRLGKICSIQGKILEIENTRTPRKRMILTRAIVSDDTSAIKVVWFNQPYLIRVLKSGDRVSLAGKIALAQDGIFLSNPAYEKLEPKGDLTHTGRIVPVYPETEGLSSKWLRRILKPLLIQFKDKIPETLPEEIIKKEKLLPISQALWQVHFPETLELAKKAQKRFQFEELFFIQLFVLREKIKITNEKAVSLPIAKDILMEFSKSLPFQLTPAQKKSAWQILKDLQKPKPMNRLLEGDVGSGKTVVAAIAALNTAKAGYQIAFMAPTEILAQQHFQEFSKLLKDFNLNIGLLTGKEDKLISKKLKNQVIEISREKLLEKTLKSEIDILIGTHALIQDKVKFGKLALVILDEQHRFGVEQRAKLVARENRDIERKIPHLLSMTATPIPRTLALTIYGDLDLSLITELPKGRKKIITKIIEPAERERVFDFIRREIQKGRQAFVICPRIEVKESQEKWQTEMKAVKAEYEKLSKEVFPDFKIGMLHGKLGLKEKEKIMQDFKNKKIDILVATSVVEVGIDVPNASVMVIEGVERFGLSQLYQFRGRVGRSYYQSYCFLLTESPSQRTRKRLKALLEAKNSFELAEKDLEIRGPGEFFGTRQWGIPDLAMTGLKDIALVEKTREVAKEILQKDPELKNYSQLRERLKRFREKVHLE